MRTFTQEGQGFSLRHHCRDHSLNELLTKGILLLRAALVLDLARLDSPIDKVTSKGILCEIYRKVAERWGAVDGDIAYDLI